MRLGGMFGAPSKNFVDRTGLNRTRPWFQAQTGNLPNDFVAMQRQWVEDSGRAITEEDNAALWDAYRMGRLQNFMNAYRDIGPPTLLTPR